MTVRSLVCAGAALVWVGCSAASKFSAPSATGGSSSDPSSTDTSGATSPPPYQPEPEFYALQLAFDLTDLGEWDPLPATIGLDLADADGVTLCPLEPALMGVRAAPIPDTDPAIYGWWKVDADEASQKGCGVLARSWWVGIGAYDPRLDPAADAHDLLDHDLYGMYLAEASGGTVWVVGYAATEDMLAAPATGDVVTAGPLPAGSWIVEQLVMMSL